MNPKQLRILVRYSDAADLRQSTILNHSNLFDSRFIEFNGRSQTTGIDQSSQKGRPQQDIGTQTNGDQQHQAIAKQVRFLLHLVRRDEIKTNRVGRKKDYTVENGEYRMWPSIARGKPIFNADESKIRNCRMPFSRSWLDCNLATDKCQLTM